MPAELPLAAAVLDAVLRDLDVQPLGVLLAPGREGGVDARLAASVGDAVREVEVALGFALVLAECLDLPLCVESVGAGRDSGQAGHGAR
ncbi:MAG TPA: hypothetical protein VIK93_03885 [Limnochordales bacterium]